MLLGLMITKGDEAILGDWCREQLPLYDAVVCLDGSEGDTTARLLAPLAHRVVYLHERDCSIPQKTDHGLRRVVHREIVRRFGPGHWVMCCHADEFCYHDPRKVAARAEREGYGLVSWFSLHVLPHPSELGDLADGDRRRLLPVPERFRHYHWDYRGSGLPWLEHRLYHCAAGVEWDETTHGSVRPHGVGPEAPWHPALLHYKVFTTAPAFYEPTATHTLYRGHWSDNPHRSGLPFRATRPEELFVASIPHYGRCDRFDGTLAHPWNIGDEYRPGTPRRLRPLRPG
jgi:hypothetical protein